MNYPLPQSCKEIKERFSNIQDGVYFLSMPSGSVFQTYCDMTTVGGGWTLVASVHKNGIKGKCTIGNVWTSQTPANSSDGGKSWSNFDIFGNVESATSSDYKNPGYYGITAEDVAVWHVPNDKQLDQWKKAAFLRYHTENSFLTYNGKNLYNLFNLYPLKELGKSKCAINNGPYAPLVYDTGNGTFNQNLYGPISRDYTAPGYIMFRATNSNRHPTAICSGVKPKDCNPERFSGYSPIECGDFAALAWDDNGKKLNWRASEQMLKAAVLIFYR